MSMVLAILAWTLAAAVLVLAAALFLPLRLELRGRVAEDATFAAGVRPFGRYGPRIPLKRQVPKPEPEKTTKKRRRFKGDVAPIVRAGVRLLQDVIGLLRIETLHLDLRFGLEDPGETGQIYGMLTPLAYGLPPDPRTGLSVEPVFGETTFAMTTVLDISVVPARLLPPLARFGWAFVGSRR